MYFGGIMRRYRPEDKIVSDINVTPLTDVALVLLIIFMVTTPLILQGGIHVKLPKAGTADTTPQRNITVSITADKKIFVNDVEKSLNDLKPYLQDSLKFDKEKLIIINADRTVMHGDVVRVLDIAKQAGATKLAIAAEKMEDK
jgi:biopolymer transport protein ExbD